MINEKEIIIRCKQGDKDAFRELYEAFSQQMMGICLRYTGNSDLAHDILHDGFVKIFSSLPKFEYRGEGSVKAWISRIVVNTALAHLKEKEKLNYVEQIEDYDKIEDESEIDVFSSVPSDVILRFIQELPVGCRTVLNMYMFEELPHSEISKQLNITDGASRVRLSRAKDILTKKIREYVREK